MFITNYQDPDAFLLKIRPTLEKDEVTNGLILGIASSLKNSSLYTRFYLATIEDEEGLLLVACMTPPYKIILSSRDPENEAAFTMLSEHLKKQNWSVSGVTGPADVAAGFAKAWGKLIGQGFNVGVHERLFVLDHVTPPVAVPGSLRIATEDDLDLIMPWGVAFMQEIAHRDEPAAVRLRTEMRVRNGEVYLWETPDKRIVSMAAKTRAGVHVITVAMVYTPPEYRGMGYASNCVAALSQLLLDQGWKYCSLFTDLSNPISNSIYQKMGYQAVCDFDDYAFEI